MRCLYLCKYKKKNGKRKTESGKLLSFSVFAWSGKTEPMHEARAEGACTLCLARRRKSLRSRIKTEKLLAFDLIE